MYPSKKTIKKFNPSTTTSSTPNTTWQMPVPDFSLFDNQKKDAVVEIKNILALFPVENNINQQRAKEGLFRASNHRVKAKVENNESYKLSGLKDLANLISHQNEISDKKALRFLLTKNDELLFAREGRPVPSVIPAHWNMSGMSHNSACCKSAGNIYFNQNMKIDKINHKSGDFVPSFDSLKSVLAILVKLDITFDMLTDNIQINELDSSGGAKTSYKVSKKLLKEQITQIIDVADIRKLIQKNKDSASHTVSYEANMPQSHSLSSLEFLNFLSDPVLAGSGISHGVSPFFPLTSKETGSLLKEKQGVNSKKRKSTSSVSSRNLEKTSNRVGKRRRARTLFFNSQDFVESNTSENINSAGLHSANLLHDKLQMDTASSSSWEEHNEDSKTSNPTFPNK